MSVVPDDYRHIRRHLLEALCKLVYSLLTRFMPALPNLRRQFLPDPVLTLPDHRLNIQLHGYAATLGVGHVSLTCLLPSVHCSIEARRMT